jgi:hypothetical protein
MTMTERPQTIPLLRLIPVESRVAVRTLFRTWQAALATDQRFSSLRKAAVTEAAEVAEAVRDGFEWRATLRPSGLPAGLDFKIRLHDKSASYTPLDRNNQAAFGRDPTNGDTYVLRQWYDSKRIGSRALNAEILASYDAPLTAELVHAPSQPNPGRGRLYLVVAKLNDDPAAVAQQTFDALAGFHRVAAIARENFV